MNIEKETRNPASAYEVGCEYWQRKIQGLRVAVGESENIIDQTLLREDLEDAQLKYFQLERRHQVGLVK